MSFITSKSFWLYFTAVFLVWIVGSYLSSTSNWNWYKSLPHSKAEPRPIVFSIVWPILYILMIIGGYIGDNDLVNSDSSQLLTARILFGVLLGLNLLWTLVFFQLQDPETAIAILVLNIALLIWLIVIYSTVSSIAAYLFIPLLVWLAFALYLNISSSKSLHKLTI